MAQLLVENLCLGYDGHEIVHGLNFSVEKGDYLVIVGENGSGKSTLMRTVLGLQKEMSGKIVYSDGLKKNEIGYLPQQTIVQKDFPASVYEIVLSGFQGKCGLRPFYTKEEKQAALDEIERMHITHLKNRCYRELSGGQQQRVLLARALCATESMLLLDEPVAGLDPTAMADMYAMIKELNGQGITIVMISHDVDHALEDASKVLKIGEEIFFGTTEEYLQARTKKGGAV